MKRKNFPGRKLARQLEAKNGFTLKPEDLAKVQAAAQIKTKKVGRRDGKAAKLLSR